MIAPLAIEVANMTVIDTTDSTIFLRLPKELQRPSLPGSPCLCPYCVTHPDEPPMWDTLAVPRHPKPGDLSWTVHHPDPRPLRGTP